MRHHFFIPLLLTTTVIHTQVQSHEDAWPKGCTITNCVGHKLLLEVKSPENAKELSDKLSSGRQSLESVGVTFNDEQSWKALDEHYGKYSRADGNQDHVMSLVKLGLLLKTAEKAWNGDSNYSNSQDLADIFSSWKYEKTVELNKSSIKALRKALKGIGIVLTDKIDQMPLHVLSLSYRLRKLSDKFFDQRSVLWRGSEEECKKSLSYFNRFHILERDKLEPIADAYKHQSFENLKERLGIPKPDQSDKKESERSSYMRFSEQAALKSHYLKLALVYNGVSSSSPRGTMYADAREIMKFVILNSKYDLDKPVKTSGSFNPSVMKTGHHDSIVFFSNPLESITPFEIHKVSTYEKEKRLKATAEQAKKEKSSWWS